MSERAFSLYIVDIFIAMNRIQRYTAEFDNPRSFLDSELEWDGTIRELEIIGEATNKLLKTELLDVKYRRIVDFRNQITHGYFGVDENIVFDVVKNKLPVYYDDLVKLSKTSRSGVLTAIQNAKKENCRNKRILEFLDLLEKEINE